MMYAGRLLAALALVAGVSVVALPNHLKAVVVDTDPAAVVPSVGASFGPYSANAGLGGSASGGGLFAAADSPHGSVSAGLGGGDGPAGGALGAEASAPAAGGAPPHKPKPVTGGPTFFDDIFNIPISVLQSVNTYLNNRGPVSKPVHRHHQRWGGSPPPTHKADAAPADADAPVAPDAGASPSPASAGAPQHQQPAVIHKKVNYDEIFNIPISALKSVNQLLNGNGKK